MCGKKYLEVESPERISRFLKTTSSIDWTSNSSEGWKTVFEKCTELIKDEIDYYYRSRKRSRKLAFWFRFLALLFGTAGFLAPLLEAAGCEGLAPFGYVLLAISAAFFAANALFGGTSGHTRYVVAQLNLEKTLTLMVVDWGKLATVGATDDERADFIKSRMSDAYAIILEETEVWGEALAKAVEAYENKVSQSGRKQS